MGRKEFGEQRPYFRLRWSLPIYYLRDVNFDPYKVSAFQKESVNREGKLRLK